MLEAVRQASTVKKFTVRFPARAAAGIASTGSFGRDARRLARLGSTTVEITLSAKGEHDRDSLRTSALGIIGELITGNARDNLEAARVEIGDDDDFGRNVVNLLGENLILDMVDALPAGNSRYLSPQVAQDLVSHAADTLRGEIEKALGELPDDPTKRSDEPTCPGLDPDT